MGQHQYGNDIYTEPRADVDTLANLGPLRALAGIWRGTRGMDTKPKAEGPKEQAFVEHYELQPIDPQTNGPQLLYGLRYHTRITKPEQIKMYHDQVGYWLWEPATGAIIQTLAIPRGQIAMAVGHASADATQFEVRAQRGSTSYGICSNPFLEEAFRTDAYRMQVTVHADGSWSYEMDTVLHIQGQTAPFHHTDHNTLQRIAAATPNPLAAQGS